METKTNTAELTPLPKPAGSAPCPDRVEIKPGDVIIPAATVKAWVAHLRSHGWTDKELDLIWLTRSRQGVTR